MRHFEDYTDEIVYDYSTRKGGVSTGIYDSMNLTFTMGDDMENVKRNFELWAEKNGVKTEDMVLLHQTHSTNVIRVDETYKGHGLDKPRIFGSDGMITNVPGVVLVTSHADCTPLYFYDPRKKAIGMTHAGWRGTVGGIAEETIRRMQIEYGTDPGDLVCRIGPCISQEFFECDRDVVDAVEMMDPLAQSFMDKNTVIYDEEAGKYHVDLADVNKAVMMSMGVPEEQITLSGICTYREEETYFSHRRQGKERGGQCALLMMKPEQK